MNLASKQDWTLAVNITPTITFDVTVHQ